MPDLFDDTISKDKGNSEAGIQYPEWMIVLIIFLDTDSCILDSPKRNF
jgi:hypothetical protein